MIVWKSVLPEPNWGVVFTETGFSRLGLGYVGQILILQPDYQAARKYWNILKNPLIKEESESVTNCHRLKLETGDGKKRG